MLVERVESVPRSTSESIDALFDVTDDEQMGSQVSSDGQNELELLLIGVLEFVDEEMSEPQVRVSALSGRGLGLPVPWRRAAGGGIQHAAGPWD